MSEKEKKRRQGYRKNREKWIFAQSVVVIVLTLAVLISAIVSAQLKATYYIGYRESGNIDYRVALKENEFYEDTYLGSNKSYVASLIDKLIADFSYEMDVDADDVNYRYSYTIKSTLEIIDDTSKVPIFNPEYELVTVNNKVQNSASTLRINEMVVIDYDYYNELASKFLETYSLTSTTSNIVLTMEVDVLSSCEAFVGSSVEKYYSELRIPLTTKTVNIKMTSAIPAAESSMIACSRGIGSEAFGTTAVVLGVVDALMILLLVAFICLTRTEDITYTARVKKIVSHYKSYIQKIRSLFDPTGYQIVIVDTFEELLEIRDTIQAPILMHENDDKTCAKFMIPTDNKLLYLYEIKIAGYEDPTPKPTPAPAPEPITVVSKPNITNVVRPVVKVVVTPPPTPEPEPIIETVVEEPEVEVEAQVEEAIPVVEATVEEESVEEEPVEEEPVEEEPIEELNEELDVEELIASIPSVEEESVAEEPAEEEPGVDVIDVVWQERREKSYRYDPDGNTVEEGDIVLVPTRDIGGNKEVVREAEVARGNYKVDPDSLSHPLKKIIGVVRRRAEKVFTAMITPDEENEEENTEQT